jgi:hypothetical protein
MRWYGRLPRASVGSHVRLVAAHLRALSRTRTVDPLTVRSERQIGVNCWQLSWLVFAVRARGGFGRLRLFPLLRFRSISRLDQSW